MILLYDVDLRNSDIETEQTIGYVTLRENSEGRLVVKGYVGRPLGSLEEALIFARSTALENDDEEIYFTTDGGTVIFLRSIWITNPRNFFLKLIETGKVRKYQL